MDFPTSHIFTQLQLEMSGFALGGANRVSLGIMK